MQERTARQANFELLRIIAMLMVVTMHFLSRTGGLPAASFGTFPGEQGVFAVFVESFCIVAVNVYVLISGYFLCEKAFSIKRLLRLLLQILFYTLLIPVVLVSIGVLPVSEVLSIYYLWNCFFPVESGHYWFVTSYMFMLLFSPVLNAAVKTLTRKQLKTVLFFLFLIFSVGKSCSVILFASDKFGYDFGWFLFLYLTAAYLREYGSVFFSGKKRCVLLYIGSCLFIAVLELVLLLICARTGGMEYYASVPFHNNFVPVLIASLALFSLFRQIRLREGRLTQLICRISPAVFGVYLIHEHINISRSWTGWLVGTPSGHLGGYMIQMIESVIAVFVVCVCIDLLRAGLFRLVEQKLGCTGIGKYLTSLLERIDGEMKK